MHPQDNAGFFAYYVNIMTSPDGDDCTGDDGEWWNVKEDAWLWAAKYVGLYEWKYIATASTDGTIASNAPEIQRLAEIISLARDRSIEPQRDTWGDWWLLESEIEPVMAEDSPVEMAAGK